MSYDRVLPKPVALHHDSLPRTSNLLDHKIMNDMPISHGALPHRPDPVGSGCRYHDARTTGMPQAHQQQVMTLNRPKHGMTRTGTSPPPLKPPGPMLTTKDLPIRDRSLSSSGSSSPNKSAHGDIRWCVCQPARKIPRPRNAFILYRQHYQAAVVHQNPGMANPEISKIIGAQWKSLTEDERAKWRVLANEEKARHSQQYPDYRYQPKRSGRDGSSRDSSSISHNPSGPSTCNRCSGRVMNAPCSPITPFTPIETPSQRSASISGASSRSGVTGWSSSGREDPKPIPKPVRIDHMESRTRRYIDEHGERSPETKRRRVSHSLKPGMHSLRDKSPESPYPMPPYSAHPHTQHRNMLPMMHPSRPYGSAQGQGLPHPDPSLKLAPLKTTTPVTPLTPFSQDGSSVEATVMTIPFLNKIKVLAKISPPLVPSFRETSPTGRGPVIAVDGQDAHLVHFAVEYLERVLIKEYKYEVRVFDGPDIRTDLNPADGGQMGDATVRYLDTISAWHRISDEVIGFVKSSGHSANTRSASPDEDSGASLSPKTIMAKTASLHINSPAQSSENGSETSAMTPCPSVRDGAVPVAIVPRYQLTTADAFACSIPINDSYAPLDHWQWMASLWRACVGPDITIYIRECSREELERAGGNPVEVRLQDARTIILRKLVGTQRELEEKALKRVSFEIEDFLTS